MIRGRFGHVPIAAVLVLLVVTPGLSQTTGQQSGPRIILSFGNDQFIPKAAIEAVTGARFQSDFHGLRFLDEASVIVLADIAFGQLPPILQSSLVQWVELGGTLLVTGGSSSFGFGAYAGTPLGSILPLLAGNSDKLGHGFSPTYVLNPGHPLFAGVTTATMANFNETTVAQDANLLLEYRGVSKGGAAGVGLTGAGRPFTTVTGQIAGGTFAAPGSPGTPSSIIVLGPRIGSGVAGTPGVGGQSTVPVPTIGAGTTVGSLPAPTPGTTPSPVGLGQSPPAGAFVAPGGTTITPGSGGQGGAVGLPTPLQAPVPTPTTTPGVLANPVLPTGGTLTAGGVPPGSYIITAPGAAGTVVVTESGGLPGQTAPGIDPGFAAEGGIQGGGRAAMPLIAERRHGNGLVLAIALDMNAAGEWQDKENLTINAVRHLLDQSKLPLFR